MINCSQSTQSADWIRTKFRIELKYIVFLIFTFLVNLSVLEKVLQGLFDNLALSGLVCVCCLAVLFVKGMCVLGICRPEAGVGLYRMTRRWIKGVGVSSMTSPTLQKD